MLPGTRLGDVVTRIRVAHDAARRVVPQHALDARRRRVGTVTADDETGVLRVTHADVAPPEVDSNRLSRAQSETASEPSSIDSVSRLGLATEPESR